MLQYHGQPGEHISKSAANSLELSRERGSPVEIIFNDIRLVVDYHSHTADQVVEMYDRTSAKRHEEWKASPAGIAYAREEEQRRLEHQTTHDQLMSQIMNVAGDEERLMSWLSAYSDAADHVGVKNKDFLQVCSILEIHGYVSKDCVGVDKSAFANPRVMARWIAGQAISCMRAGMPPHPMTSHFVEKYQSLVQKNPVDTVAESAIVELYSKETDDDSSSNGACGEQSQDVCED